MVKKRSVIGTFQERAIAELRAADEVYEPNTANYHVARAQVWATLAVAVELESLPKER